MNLSPLFNILDKVDSTNNYAMGMVHEGMAKHGEAWFAREQTAGKGQRGKRWFSERDSSVLLSISLQPSGVFISNPFYLSALAAVVCKKFLERHTEEKFFIKWPNDLYWRDRKTGGILIENNYSGQKWSWAVIGIGINVRQPNVASDDLLHAVSLDSITPKDEWSAEALARELHQMILQKLRITASEAAQAVEEFNTALYQRNEMVRFKKGNVVFTSRVKEVNRFGQLITEDNMQRVFNHGEIEWMSPA